ncbi:hypothetical protein [Nocardioides sp. YIM 152315]|uniref:hypothetical protein n=1 Tax=Nocardioides sp. YIM 152315 TaxID=3031760 RepID=UPI0023DB524F|nr:hypothetical protein [Nocardioides sp. YIM 152315]MDF1602821.1 hypothetical protein [Nocardioides sp. YIM 152315]
MLWVVTGVALVLVTALVAVAGHRMLTAPGPRSSGFADGLGNFIDVFDPARARADEDLRSRKFMGEVLPSPDDEDHPVWRVDLQRNQVRIPRAR